MLWRQGVEGKKLNLNPISVHVSVSLTQNMWSMKIENHGHIITVIILTHNFIPYNVQGVTGMLVVRDVCFQSDLGAASERR